MKEILNRRSIRKYTDEKIDTLVIGDLLKAAMAAPSAGNEQPWEFIVIKNKNTLKDLTKIHPYASMLKEADTAIIVCGNLNKQKFEGYWAQDVSAATENILIEAEHKNLGAVWLGVYPTEDRVKSIKAMFNLPNYIIPFSIISLGYKNEEKEPTNRYDKSKIHYERW
ncbi:MAG: nitroreductase family protein [Firmicutes bacterium]|nr:nitroreductase family protein [Bacillota bacterium]